MQKEAAFRFLLDIMYRAHMETGCESSMRSVGRAEPDYRRPLEGN